MKSKISEINFKVVPETLEDITPFWCQTILHEGSVINKGTTVTAVEIKQITDEESGFKNGGGLSGSTLVKLIPTYGWAKDSLLGVDSLLGDCTFIPADWGS